MPEFCPYACLHAGTAARHLSLESRMCPSCSKQNVSIVAHYIKERTKNAQFIIISLRNNMFELADRLVGIYKTHVRPKLQYCTAYTDFATGLCWQQFTTTLGACCACRAECDQERDHRPVHLQHGRCAVTGIGARCDVSVRFESKILDRARICVLGASPTGWFG